MSSRLSWSRHSDALGIAVLAHGAAARGHAIHLTADGYAGPDSLAQAARNAGLPAAVVSGDAATPAQLGQAIALPRIVLYCGAAIGYPYYAYYSHCLWSLGLRYRRATAADIAGGMLDDADVLILPGGFATWGLDRIENQAGVDDAVRAFLARGGVGIGSCGGAYYFSQGRPHWLGALDAKPRYTHEYLCTGAGLLNVRLDDAALRRDLPETMELAYYHGPVYERGPRHARTGGTFESHIMSTRLFIDNPLEAERFDRVMRDRVAILASDAPDGRVIGFSPHPEMGEFLRKAMALDGYVRKYLPIRGHKTMDETLRFYAGEDCLSFRLVLNAALMLGAFDVVERSADAAARDAAARDAAAGARRRSLAQDLQLAGQAWHSSADAVGIRLAYEEPELADLMGAMLRALGAEWDALVASQAAQDWSDDALSAELGHVLDEAVLALQGPPRRAVEMLVLLELPVRLLAAAARIVRFDRIVEELM
jgi:putative intracellular protease/amidase